jgi:hypothetical protein
MTKAQTTELAKKHAAHNTEAKAMTVAQIEATEWTARRDIARDYAQHSLATTLGVTTRYAADYRVAYEDAILTMWAGTLKAIENARRAFKVACDGMSPSQASAKAADILRSFNFRGARPVEHGYIEIVRGNRISACLYFDFSRQDGDVSNPDNISQRAFRYGLNVRVSTSGTTYGLADLAVANGIHADLLAAGAELTSAFEGERVVSTWGMESDECPGCSKIGKGAPCKAHAQEAVQQ